MLRRQAQQDLLGFLLAHSTLDGAVQKQEMMLTSEGLRILQDPALHPFLLL